MTSKRIPCSRCKNGVSSWHPLQYCAYCFGSGSKSNPFEAAESFRRAAIKLVGEEAFDAALRAGDARLQ